MKISVYVVEDGASVRACLEQMIEGIEGVAYLGYSDEADHAVREISRLLPHIVILDLALHKGNGLNVLAAIKLLDPTPVVIVLTNYADNYYRLRANRAGADYFFDKSHEFERVEGVITEIVNNVIVKADVNEKQSGLELQV